MDWHQSFGGTPINLPSVKQHSTIDQNTEKVRLNHHNFITLIVTAYRYEEFEFVLFKDTWSQ